MRNCGIFAVFYTFILKKKLLPRDLLKSFRNQHHLAFGSLKTRIVTSIAECAKRYLEITDEGSNIVKREEQRISLIITRISHEKFINYSFSNEKFTIHNWKLDH